MNEDETKNKISLIETSLDIASNEKTILANGYQEISEFQKYFISAIVAMANNDNYFTYYEYEKLFIIVDEIINIFSAQIDEDPSNLVFDKLLIYNFIYEKIRAGEEWQIQIKKLKNHIEKELKELNEEDSKKFKIILQGIFEIIVPMIQEQEDVNDKIDEWADVLFFIQKDKYKRNVDEKKREDTGFLNSLINIKNKVSSIISDNKEKELNNYKIKKFFLSIANSFEMSDLVNELQKKNSTDSKEVFIKIKMNVIKLASENIPDKKELQTLKELSDNYISIIKAFVEQAKKRLEIIHPRLKFQLDVFNEDYKNFKESSLMLLYKSLSTGITEDEIKYGDYAENLKFKYSKLQNRHEKFIKLWENEISAFNIELKELSGKINIEIFKDKIDITEIEKRLNKKYSMHSFKKKIYKISKKISAGTDIGIAIGAGSILSSIVGISAITSLVTGPIGLAIVGSIATVVGFSKLISVRTNLEKEKEKELSKRIINFENIFEEIFPNPENEYINVLNEIYTKFISTSKKYYEPLFLKVVLLSSEIELKKEIFTSMIKETEKALDTQINNFIE